MMRFKIGLYLSDLICHNGQTADHLNPFSKTMKQLTGKRQKTDADYAQLADVEYRAGLYTDSKNRVVIPSRVLEASIAEGARKSKEGKLALSGLFVDTDAVLDHYDGGPLTIEELTKSPDHRLTVGVRVGTNRVMRTRPIFRNVETSFEVSLNPEVANEEQLKLWLANTVAMVGIGDWRPRHGRGEIRSIEQIKTQLRSVA